MTFRLDWPTPAEILQREPSISKFFPHFSKLFISEQRLQSRPVVKQTITFLSRLRREKEGEEAVIEINRIIRLSWKQMMGNGPTALILIRGRKVDREPFSSTRYTWHATRGGVSTRKRFCIFRRPFLAYEPYLLPIQPSCPCIASVADIPIPNSTLCLAVNAQISIFYSSRTI